MWSFGHFPSAQCPIPNASLFTTENTESAEKHKQLGSLAKPRSPKGAQVCSHGCSAARTPNGAAERGAGAAQPVDHGIFSGGCPGGAGEASYFAFVSRLGLAGLGRLCQLCSHVLRTGVALSWSPTLARGARKDFHTRACSLRSRLYSLCALRVLCVEHALALCHLSAGKRIPQPRIGVKVATGCCTVRGARGLC